MNCPGNHEVPASAAGTAFQFQRALLHLVSAVDGCIGVETDDDVAGRSDTDLRKWEQDKLSFQTGKHPLTDYSKNLWNTFLIWLEKLHTGPITPTNVELHLVTNRPVPACLARDIADASDGQGVATCIATMRSMSSEQSDIQKLIDRVLSYTDEQLAAMIIRVQLHDAGVETNPATIPEEIVKQLQCPSWVSGKTVGQALMGWLHEVVMDCWTKREPAWITAQAFTDRKHAIIEELKSQHYRTLPASAVIVTSEQRAAAKLRQFVYHLSLIEADDDEVSDAVEEFLRFDSEHSRLLREGSLQARDFHAFFDELKHRWRKILLRLRRNSGTRKEIGHNIFTETCDAEYRGPLGDEVTIHSYFTCGGYHALADSDAVWWHPDYDQKNTGDQL